MIRTKKFELTPIAYYKIVVRNHLRATWFLYIGCFFYSMKFFFSNDRSTFAIFMIFFGIAYTPLSLIYFYFWATSKKNKAIFLNREITIDTDKIYIQADGEISSELPLRHIQKTVEEKDYFLLYIAKSQFIYIPKFAFNSDVDLDVFIKTMKNIA